MRNTECKRSACLIAANLFSLLGAGAAEQPAYAIRSREERSPQWREGRFVNLQPLWMDQAGALLSLFSKSPFNAPAASVPVCHDAERVLSRAPEDGLRATWLGHSSVVLEIDGRRLLIDPVWSERSSPFSWVGPKRWYPPVLSLEKLPPLDAVMISHDHYDHLDRETIVALKERAERFIVPLGVGARLRDWGVEPGRIIELDWWESCAIGSLRVHATPARHASGRSLLDRDKSLWCGYVFAGPEHRVYYSGDSGMMKAFPEIGRRFGPFDLTMIEIGEYSQKWPDWHMGPEQAVEVHRMVRGKVLLPVHWGLFALSTHSWTEPIERVAAAAAAQGVTLATPRPGESISPCATQRRLGERWWPTLPWRQAQEYPIRSTPDGKKIEPPTKEALKRQNAALVRLKLDLRDKAFEFDRSGQPEAADLAHIVVARVDEILEPEG